MLLKKSKRFNKTILRSTAILMIIIFSILILTAFISAEEEEKSMVAFSYTRLDDTPSMVEFSLTRGNMERSVSASASVTTKSAVKKTDSYTKAAKKVTTLDLDYWYRGIDAEAYSRAIINAIYRVGYPGLGLCATWVGNVYRAAGLGYIDGNACDMWRTLCNSASAADIREGMIIAVRNSAASELGMVYGHCGIIIRNPSYQGSDLLEEISPLVKRIEYLEPLLEQTMNNTDQKMIRVELRTLKEALKPLEAENTDNFYYVDGRLIQADSNWNEKWLVVDSTTCISTSTLSSWLREFDIYSTAAWGWGHSYSGAVVWNR